MHSYYLPMFPASLRHPDQGLNSQLLSPNPRTNALFLSFKPISESRVENNLSVAVTLECFDRGFICLATAACEALLLIFFLFINGPHQRFIAILGLLSRPSQSSICTDSSKRHNRIIFAFYRNNSQIILDKMSPVKKYSYHNCIAGFMNPYA